ncbi:hypothetical protein [Pelagibacterium sediminicola]|uniref:hypothetical protein n=1 Tax=Pelagibacterium sediminicola TaxID=2248761 RepID=UPI000E310137|nr:hypothetical protein [Pelagibacterium sediminicola]
MTSIFPPLSIPSDIRIGFFATVSPKKSAKTTVCRIAANEFADAGRELIIFQHDEHPLLSAYAEPTRIELAKAAQVMRGNVTIDLTNHTPLSDALLTLPSNPHRIVMLDASAVGSERIASILHAGRFNSWLASQSIHAMFCVPMRAIEDSALGAISMIEELHAVMPEHFVVPIPICDPRDLALLPNDHPFFAALKMARHGVIPLPTLSPEFASALERLERPLTEIADPDSEDMLTYISHSTGHGRLVAGLVSEAAQHLIAEFEEGMRPLTSALEPDE